MAELNKDALFAALEQVAKQNLISQDEIINIIKEAILKSFHSKFDPDAELELIINPEKKEFELINHTKLVVEDSEASEEYKAIEIPISKAKKIKANIEVGDVISERIDFAFYAKIIAQQIRQILTQNVRERKKEVIYSKHKFLQGEMIDVVVLSVSNTFATFALEDGTTAFMPLKFMNPNANLKIGERVKVYVEEVLKESKDSQIIVSNGSKILIKRILELEVPEIESGIVEIVAIARIMGERSKIAVKSTDPNVDPIGAIIGSEGARIRSIIEKLNGEKLDLILWSSDQDAYAANALAPAKAIAVLDKPSTTEGIKGGKLIITPDKHQTLAIGKKGSNVRLAVELTGIKIDVISLSQAKERGIEFEWNGNITPQGVERLEGNADASSHSSRFNSNRSTNTSSGFNSRDFDSYIDAFNEEIETDETKEFVKNEQTSFPINEDLFSDEELSRMEADFEFDDEDQQ